SYGPRLQGGRGKAMDPKLVWSGSIDGMKSARQIELVSSDALGSSSIVNVLWAKQGTDYITSLQLDAFVAQDQRTTALQSTNLAIDDSKQQTFLLVANLHKFCLQSQALSVSLPQTTELQLIYVGLGSSGKLHTTTGDSHRVLAANTMHPGSSSLSRHMDHTTSLLHV
ncbi:hypothetical protein H0H92_004572, partial [Tricholoma furcatifolium]